MKFILMKFNKENLPIQVIKCINQDRYFVTWIHIQLTIYQQIVNSPNYIIKII